MGMPVSVHLRGDAARTAVVADRVAAAFEQLRGIDALFSPYRPDSEVSRIDRGDLAAAAAHPLVSEVLSLCEMARAQTGGAFNAYRADPAAGGRLHFDPSGLVKGWAVERTAASLAALPGCDVSVNAGGDIAGQVTDRARHPWRIGIEDPRDPSRLLAVLPLRTGGVATSGTAHRGQHIVRPSDGSPASELLSVTVTGPSLLWADVYATAAFVKGSEALRWLAELPGYEGIVVDRTGARATPGLEVLASRWRPPTPRAVPITQHSPLSGRIAVRTGRAAPVTAGGLPASATPGR